MVRRLSTKDPKWDPDLDNHPNVPTIYSSMIAQIKSSYLVLEELTPAAFLIRMINKDFR